MRYHISGKIRAEKKQVLAKNLCNGTVAENTIFHGGMMAGLRSATVDEKERIHFIEVCYCLESGLDPMQMEIPYLENYFDEITVKDARKRKKCTMECEGCDCTRTYRLPGAPISDQLDLQKNNFDSDYIDSGRISLNRMRQLCGIEGLRKALNSDAEVFDGGTTISGFYVIFSDGDEFFRIKEIPETPSTRSMLQQIGLAGLTSVKSMRRSALSSLAARDSKSNIT